MNFHLLHIQQDLVETAGFRLIIFQHVTFFLWLCVMDPALFPDSHLMSVSVCVSPCLTGNCTWERGEMKEDMRTK